MKIKGKLFLQALEMVMIVLFGLGLAIFAGLFTVTVTFLCKAGLVLMKISCLISVSLTIWVFSRQAYKRYKQIEQEDILRIKEN